MPHALVGGDPRPGMLYDEIDAPGELTSRELRDRYETHLAAITEDVGLDAIRAATGLDDDAIARIDAGEFRDVELRDIAAILALDNGAPDLETILGEIRHHLLLEMSNAVLNVDVIAGDIELDLSPKEIQAKLEGRHPMTLDEYAVLHHYIASEADW